MTGQHVGRNEQARCNLPLELQNKTFLSLLNEAGYRVGYIGKWGLGETRGSFPTDHGVHQFCGTLTRTISKYF